MSTHFDFFLSVCAHRAEKEFRGFTSSEDTCVPYSCAVHLGSGIKALLRLLVRKAGYHQTKLLPHRRIDTDLREKDNLAEAVIFTSFMQILIADCVFLWFVDGESLCPRPVSSRKYTHTHQRERESTPMGRCFGWAASYRFRTLSIVGHAVSFQPVCEIDLLWNWTWQLKHWKPQPAFVSADSYKLINTGFYSPRCSYGLNIDRLVTIAICMLVPLKGNYHL